MKGLQVYWQTDKCVKYKLYTAVIEAVKAFIYPESYESVSVDPCLHSFLTLSILHHDAPVMIFIPVIFILSPNTSSQLSLFDKKKNLVFIILSPWETVWS